MSIFHGKCKMCGIPLQVEMDDEFSYPGTDPMGLVEKLTCNRCFDIRYRFKRIMEFIEDRVAIVNVTDPENDGLRARLRQHLGIALEKMAVVLADSYRCKNWIKPEDVNKTVGILMDHPKAVSDTMQSFRQLCRHRAQTYGESKIASSPGPTSLPYADS